VNVLTINYAISTRDLVLSSWPIQFYTIKSIVTSYICRYN